MGVMYIQEDCRKYEILLLQIYCRSSFKAVILKAYYYQGTLIFMKKMIKK